MNKGELIKAIADKAGFQRTADFMFENGMIENKLDVSTLFYE